MGFIVNSILIGLGMTIGDVLFKFWQNAKSLHILYWISGVIFYIGALTLLGYNFKNYNFTTLVIVTIILNIVFVSISGYLFFGDVLSFKKLLGIVISFLSIYLLV